MTDTLVEGGNVFRDAEKNALTQRINLADVKPLLNGWKASLDPLVFNLLVMNLEQLAKSQLLVTLTLLLMKRNTIKKKFIML